MKTLLGISNLKTYLIIAGVSIAIWFYKDYKYVKAEKERIESNISSIRKSDSLRYSEQILSRKEFKEELEYNNKELLEFIKSERIRMNRIERVITQKLSYEDKQERSVNLQPILEAIKEQRSLKVPVIDSTECLIVSGFVTFDNDTLSLDINNRKFTNKTEVISYWERNQWKFLGIKTRLFGKKEITVTIKDACGETITEVVNVGRKKKIL